MPLVRYKLVFWAIAGIGGFYAAFLCLLTNPWLQRQALYAHKLNTVFWHDLDDPEYWGFAKHQVSPFRIETPDKESLYAWHVLPLGIYAEQEAKLRAENRSASDSIEDSLALGLLQDSQTRLIINFHGNAGHIVQGWRSDAYKSFTACDSMRTHVLSFDYRGFGISSSGPPSEHGLITDGIAVVDWAMNIAHVPPERIVLLGHSLGTAVATAVADHFASTSPQVTFAGLVLVSGFSDIPNLMKTYLVGGFIPVLSPLKSFPRVEKLISDRIVDTWYSVKRLKHLAETSLRLYLTILHAKNDFDIGWEHSNILFEAAKTGITKSGQYPALRNGDSDAPLIQTADAKGDKQIKRIILEHGGHNQIISNSQLAVEIHKAFGES